MAMKRWTAIAEVYDPLKAGSIDSTDTEPHDRAIIRAMNAKYKPNKSVDGDPRKTIFIARLNHSTEEDTLWTAFRIYGKIKKCRLVRDIVTGFSKGYGFIEYEDEEDAFVASKRGNKTVIDQAEVFVDMECERTLKGWVPRRLGGGVGGNKKSGQLRFGAKDRPFIKPILPAVSRDGEQDKYVSRQDWSDRNRSRDDERESNRDRDHRRYRDDRRKESRGHREDEYKSHNRRRRERSQSPSKRRTRKRSRSPSDREPRKQINEVDSKDQKDIPDEPKSGNGPTQTSSNSSVHDLQSDGKSTKREYEEGEYIDT